MSERVVDAEALYEALRLEVRRGLDEGRLAAAELAVIGVHSGGAWVAERLHRDLGLAGPLGFLSSAFHRDDYGERGLPTTIQATAIDFPVEGRAILLVDDILFTGRTIRAGLNEIFDYGRPARVDLAVLIDRGGRELPFRADYVGASMPLADGERFELSQQGDGRFVLRIGNN